VSTVIFKHLLTLRTECTN